MGRTWNLWVFKLVVRIVTTGLESSETAIFSDVVLLPVTWRHHASLCLPDCTASHSESFNLTPNCVILTLVTAFRSQSANVVLSFIHQNQSFSSTRLPNPRLIHGIILFINSANHRIIIMKCAHGHITVCSTCQFTSYLFIDLLLQTLPHLFILFFFKILDLATKPLRILNTVPHSLHDAMPSFCVSYLKQTRRRTY